MISTEREIKYEYNILEYKQRMDGQGPYLHDGNYVAPDSDTAEEF